MDAGAFALIASFTFLESKSVRRWYSTHTRSEPAFPFRVRRGILSPLHPPHLSPRIPRVRHFFFSRTGIGVNFRSRLVFVPISMGILELDGFRTTGQSRRIFVTRLLTRLSAPSPIWSTQPLSPSNSPMTKYFGKNELVRQYRRVG